VRPDLQGRDRSQIHSERLICTRQDFCLIDATIRLCRNKFPTADFMSNPSEPGTLTIDKYLRERLMPVEGAIPHIPGIEMFGNSVPAENVGGDLFEYINFQQRYDVDARIQQAHRLSQEFLEQLPEGAPPRNSVDDQVQWLKGKPGFRPEMEEEYRFARSSEQTRVAEELQDLCSTAGVLVVDAQGHGIISAKIASTVHDTFQALMLTELDRYGKATPMLLENLNLRLAQSATARNALGFIEKEGAREIATMIYGEVRPSGQFRFANFGHPPPLVFSAEYRRFMKIDATRMVQFFALGLQIPASCPDRKRYYSLNFRQTPLDMSNFDEITLMSPGDILVLYTDGVYDGSDQEAREQLEALMREHYQKSAREICDTLLDYAIRRDERLRLKGELDLIDDKTVFIVKRS
jgi:serine phosphatase RsbU (regulator of sigma subunit)